MDDLLSEFITETAEALEVIDAELVRFEAEPNDKDILNNVFRLVHTIKGTCGFLGLPRLEAVAHAGETLLGKFRDGSLQVTPSAVSIVLESIDQIKALMGHLEDAGAEPPGDDSDLIGRLEAAAEGKVGSSEVAEATAPAPQPEPAQAAAPAATGTAEAKKPRPADLPADVRWDEDLGRELRPGEVSLAELEAAFAAAEYDVSGTAADAEMLRMAEETEAQQELPELPEIAETADQSLAQMAAAAAALSRNKDDAGGKAEGGGLASQSIRVSVDVLEHLMNMVSELVLTRNQLMQMVRSMDDSEFKAPLQRLSNVTGELQDAVMATRMQPIGNAWKKLPRIVRDAATDLNKRIRLVMEGDQTELDRQVLELIRDPLTHMVRNSCDHAIELPSDRMAVGKPEEGTIVLRAYHEGGHIIIELRDDGAGLKTARIRQKAIENGVISAEEAATMPVEQIQRLIFAPGFSTAEKITNLSGRGVGMDVVRTNIELIGGAIDLTTKEGEGTCFTIKIPLTLAIVSALIVGVRGQRFAVPQLSVVELVRTGSNSDNRIESINGTRVMRLRDRLLPVLPLAGALKISEDWGEKSNHFVIVMQMANQKFGLVVDEVFDTEEIVVKPLSSVLRNVSEYSGSTILGDGSVIMILDPMGLARLAAFDTTNANNASQIAAEVKSMENSNDRQSLLVFSAGGSEPKCCPLSLVTRLEEIDVSRIEMTKRGPVVQYRGNLMPIVHLAGQISANEDGKQPLLVISQGKHVVGLGVDQVLDITEDSIDVKISDDTPGVLGTAVIDEKATEIIDVGYFLSLANYDWASRVKEKDHKPRSILVFETNPFFRNLLAPILKSSGYKVTMVGSAEEAARLDLEPQMFDAILADIDEEAEGNRFLAGLEEDADWRKVPRVALSDTDQFVEGDFSGCVRKSDRQNLLAVLGQTVAMKGKAA